jgi:hypothetical protein
LFLSRLFLQSKKKLTAGATRGEVRASVDEMPRLDAREAACGVGEGGWREEGA